MDNEFQPFSKIARLNRLCVITEKLDGTNAQVFISDDGLEIRAGSRTRWITPQDDNYGFARWVEANKEELLKLGPGQHFGEWWGNGIQRGYGLANGDKRLYLFNTARWNKDNLPPCVGVVPQLYYGPFHTEAVNACVEMLRDTGSVVVPGFMKPEGVIVYHEAAKSMFKVTLDKDNEWKGKAA